MPPWAPSKSVSARLSPAQSLLAAASLSASAAGGGAGPNRGSSRAPAAAARKRMALNVSGDIGGRLRHEVVEQRGIGRRQVAPAGGDDRVDAPAGELDGLRPEHDVVGGAPRQHDVVSIGVDELQA